VTTVEILSVLLLAAFGWFIWSTLQAREAANTAMRAACEAQGFFFLDDTVALQKIWPVRNHHGQMTLRRVYDFAYSDTGHNRRHGTISLLGNHVESLNLDPRMAAGETLL
jgi:hypothetical protein